MKKNDVKLLIVEDCTIIAQAYKNVIDKIPEISFDFLFAENCDEALKNIQQAKPEIVLLDLRLPPSKNNRIVSGEDLEVFIRKEHPFTKIIILTNVTDSLRLLNIIKAINPDGAMIKTDIDPIDIRNAIVSALKRKKYYSKTIEGYTKEIMANGLSIDDFDRQILYHLSMGEKTKDITKYVSLSTRTIEVRKNKLKLLLNTKPDENFNLVKAAKNRGVI